MDNPLSNEELLKQFGGVDSNSLEKMLQGLTDENEINTVRPSPYYSIDNLPSAIHESDENFITLSLNIQSLNSKFSSFKAMVEILEDQGVRPDAFLLQETWLSYQDIENSLSLFELEGYECIAKGHSSSKHGGLVIYLKSCWEFKVLDICSNSSLWEGLFIEITDGKQKKN